MRIVQVNYRRELGQEDSEQAAQLAAAAAAIADLPGLVWKIWIYDDERHLAGGIYLFATDVDARRWGDELPRSLGRLPGITAIDTQYFDVDERLSGVTRGPVAPPAPA